MVVHVSIAKVYVDVGCACFIDDRAPVGLICRLHPSIARVHLTQWACLSLAILWDGAATYPVFDGRGDVFNNGWDEVHPLDMFSNQPTRYLLAYCQLDLDTK